MKVAHPHHLTVGSHGAPVEKLEKELHQRGLLEGRADGDYDGRTKEAVKRFERQNGLHVDGNVGGRIWRMLNLGAAHEGSVHEGSAQGGRSGSFRTVTLNVKSNPEMPQAQVVHDVRAAAKEGSVIGWQEIGPDRYFDAIKDLGPDWGHYMPKDGHQRIPVPISWNKNEWEKVDAGFERTHNGRAKVSPHRYISWVELKNKDTGATVVRVNTHAVSGAWSEPKATTGWRREMWNRHMEKLHDLVAKLERQGKNVVIGGDFNRDSYKVLGRQVRYDSNLHQGTHGRSTYDYLMSSGRDLEAKQVKVKRGFASDHDAVVGTYKIDD